MISGPKWRGWCKDSNALNLSSPFTGEVPRRGGGGTLSLQMQARKLRKSMTQEEVKLWVHLKVLNKNGTHFRRQCPLDGYILDFAEFKHRLIIEIDGSQHGEAPGLQHDRIRDAHFMQAGFRVLRFWNNQINKELSGVMDTILDAIKDPPPSLRATSPVKGEDK
jgi:very-short-patch-repair endonuclease